MTVLRDEMAVKLTFDNRQFEQGVKQSAASLENFKQSIDFSKQTSALTGLKNAVTGLSFNGFKDGASDVRHFGSAIDVVAEKTNKLYGLFGSISGKLKMMVLDKVANKIKNIFTAIPNQIISGGKRRAQNIEQAQFQLKGLLKDSYDWKKISDDIDFAVSGTRYGLDAAAKVAAQLSASNISFGDEMKSALRGISGVAAMTNSEYEDIGHIFTTIAGQGKVMTQQLNQFAGRGLNVAATLAEYYKVDEAKLREMVTKGKVDFKTFAIAMNEAFGEQATKANDTFSGALSNVKASLSRMGAQFATPAYEELRKVLVMLIPVFKDIEKFIKPVSASFEQLAQTISSFAIDTLRDIHFDFLDMLGAKGTGFASQVSEVQNVLDDLRKSADETLKVEGETTEAVTDKTLENQKSSVDLYQKAIDARNKIEESAKKRIEAGEDEALVLREQEISLLDVAAILNDYESSTNKAAKGTKNLTDVQQKNIGTIRASGFASTSARDKALELYKMEMQEAALIKDNTEARKTYSEVINESMTMMGEESSKAAASLFGLEDNQFADNVKSVSKAIEDVGKAADDALTLDTTKKADQVKALTTQVDKTKKVYEAFEKAMDDINKKAEAEIKAGKDEVQVNKDKEAAIKALKDQLAAFDKQASFSLSITDKNNKGREITNKLYENAKKAVSGVSDKVLKLFGIEKEEGEQISKNASEYKGLEELAWDVISGKYGNGEERKKALEELGLSYAIIQNKVNELLGVEKRHEVTAEDEAKMAKKLGTAYSEAGEDVNREKTTFEKLLDILAGIGAVINIIREAGTAVVNNILRPFLSWALPKVLDAIATPLSWIGEKLVKLNESWHDSDFFNVKTQELADWFRNLADKVSEFWSKAKELEGVKKLKEAFENLKKTLAEIGGKVWDKIKEGFKGVGDQGSTIFTMENMLNVLNNIANVIANILNFINEHKDEITTILSTVIGTLFKISSAILTFIKDPKAAIKDLVSFIRTNFATIKSYIISFFTNLTSNPKATFDGFVSGLLKAFSSIKIGLKNGLKSFLAGDKVFAAEQVQGVIDDKAISDSLFDKAKNFALSFVNGIKEFFSEKGFGGKAIGTVRSFLEKIANAFNFKKVLKVAGLGVFGVIVAKIVAFINSFRIATVSLSKILKMPAN